MEKPATQPTAEEEAREQERGLLPPRNAASCGQSDLLQLNVTKGVNNPPDKRTTRWAREAAGALSILSALADVASCPALL
jgi:hypothetical protein